MKKIAAVLFVASMALGACGGKSKSESTMDKGAGSGSGSTLPMGGAGYGGAAYGGAAYGGAPTANPCAGM